MSLPDVRVPERVARNARAGFFGYETLEYDGQLEIGEGGRVARFARRQLIRFLEDDVTLFVDRVWGEGVLFAGYDAGSARITDALTAGKGYVVLLSLPRRFQKGETFEIVTERKIVGAFTDRDAYWELAMFAPTASLNLHVSDRSARVIRTVHVSAADLSGVEAHQRNRSLRLKVDSPVLYARYRLDWRWN